jgi:hypothetical protein
MSILKSLFEKRIPQQLPPESIDSISTQLGIYSRLGIVLAIIWFVLNRPFWRHAFVALCAMTFGTLMLPTTMLFFVRHPDLTFAIPFAAGFTGANLGRSGVRTVAAWSVLVVLAVVIYQSAAADSVIGPWLR